MELVDINGQPLNKKTLLQEQATPSLTGIRSIRSNDTSYGLDPGKLGRILRGADDGDIEDYLDLAEEIEEKEAHYHSVLGTRKRAVSQLEITVEPASDDKVDIENAALIEDWLDRDTLEDELVDILDAIGKGFSATEILWELSESQWMPIELKRRDPRWFAFDRVDGETLMMRDGAHNVPLMPYKFLVHKHRAKSGLAIRGGVVRPVFWMFLFKNFAIKDWVTFAEAYGQPLRVGKYNSGASKDDKDVLLRAVANIGSDAAAIIPESMMIEFVDSKDKAQTADVFEKLVRFTDEQVSKIVLGQTMTTDSGSSRSQAEVHNEVKHDIERSDAKQLAATLNQQLVKPIIILNKGEQKRYPRIRIGRTENVDIEMVTNAADKLVRMGAKISRKQLLEKTGFSEPENDDDALTIPQTTSAANTNSQEDVASQKKTLPNDAIGSLEDEMASSWEEVVNPAKLIIERAAKESSSYEEFQQNLLELASDIDMDGAADLIARGNFAVNIAGQVDANIEGER